MMLWNKIKNLLIPVYKPPEITEKTLKDLEVLDTVWILDSDNILLQGWVFEKTTKHVIVVVSMKNNKSLDFRFTITKPLSQTQITQNGKILFLNKPCM